MGPLTAVGLIRVWERGKAQRPFDRALTLLSAGMPDASSHAAAGLSIGQRDTGLLVLREESLGGSLRAFSECPICGTALGFVLETKELKSAFGMDEPPGDGVVSRDGFRSRFVYRHLWISPACRPWAMRP